MGVGGLVDKGRVMQQDLGMRERGCGGGGQEEQAAGKEELKKNI